MARPRAFDLAEAEASLLGPFWRRGFTATSIPDLSAATGLLPGSLYAAFGSKDEMFEVALKRYAAWLADELRTKARGLAAIEAMLDTIVRLTIEDSERRGCPMINAIAEAPSLTGSARAYIAAGMASLRRLFRARLTEAVQDTGARVAMDELEALLFSASVSIRVLGRARAPASLLRDIARGTLAGVRAQFEPPPRRTGRKQSERRAK